jgi:NADH-quinone oxidoreductase subunit C
MDPAVLGTQAVFEALPEDPAVKALREFATDAKYDRGELTLTVARESIVSAAEALRRAGFTFFEDVTAVDWYPSEPRFQISYSFLSLTLKRRVRVVVRLTGDDAVLDSLTPNWPAANFYEREVFDLFGVRFSGHPYLRRIMMPEDWQGHPLRKDYPVEGYR